MAFSIFTYVRMHFTLVLAAFKVALVSTTVSPLKPVIMERKKTPAITKQIQLVFIKFSSFPTIQFL